MNNNNYQALNEQFLIHTDSTQFNIISIHTFLSSESYWAKNIPFETVKKSIDNSLCFGVFSIENANAHKQIGFARLVTDYATFAYLCDVYIEKEYRGKGLSKWLMQVIHAHPNVQGIRRWMLVTKDAQSLYKQFNWQMIPEEMLTKMMQIHQPDIYI